MTPGGTDVVISTDRPVELMELAVRWLFEKWPHGVVSSDEGTWSRATFYLIPFGQKKELFVHRGLIDFDVSADDPTGVDMIHLLRRDTELTVVMDPGSPAGLALEKMLRATKFPGASFA